MKKLLLIVFCGAILLNGCYSYSVLESDDKGPQLPRDNENIIVTLQNGSVIESEAHRHIIVNTPSNFIYGVGMSLKQNIGGEFKGRIDPAIIDSSKASDYNDVHYRSFWLKDSSRILFSEGDYLTVTPDQGTGLWCMGQKSDGKSSSTFAGKVVFGDVKAIEVKNFSVGKTIWMGVLSGVATGLLLAAISEHGGFMSGIEYLIGPVLGSLIGLLVGSIVAAAW